MTIAVNCVTCAAICCAVAFAASTTLVVEDDLPQTPKLTPGASEANGDLEGCKEDTLHNDVITRLLQRYLDAREHVATWAPLYGPNHLAVIRLRNEMTELQNSIVDELQLIAQTYKSDYEIAKAREDSLRASLGKQIQERGWASGELIYEHQLAELNSDLIAATAATAQAKARLERVEQVLKSPAYRECFLDSLRTQQDQSCRPGGFARCPR
jgi:uncharacterized protein involved in exopolysaccharide biosynthesis